MATEVTLAQAVELCRELIEKHGISISRVYRHFDVEGKHCLAYFMGEEKWAEFKEQLEWKKEEEMGRFNAVEEIREKASLALPTVKRLVDAGTIQGSGKKDANEYPAEMDLLRICCGYWSFMTK